MARIGRRVAVAWLLVTCVAALSAAAPVHTASGAATVAALPAGFYDEVVASGFDRPTVLRFAPNGKIFVGEQGGKIVVLDGFGGTRADFADLTAEVDNYWDRGLLGLTLDPAFPSSPYLYALYAYDAPPGATAPVWHDVCPTPPGPNTDGCTVQGRLVRLTADGTSTAIVPGSEKVLIQDWCQQYPSHSLGDLQFGPDGALYATGGEGASFQTPDYGQLGGTLHDSPTGVNPCSDPPNEGGALRSQSYRWPEGRSVLGGALIRVDPATGNGLPGNPGYSSADPGANRGRIVAYGFRNPFRFTFRPGTVDLWLGDVGEDLYEEIDHIPSPTAPTAANFGWPCFEGVVAHTSFAALGLPLCDNDVLPIDRTAKPYFFYDHWHDLFGCTWTHGSSITGLAFYSGDGYPAAYKGGLFFADHTRDCIWWLPPTGVGGAPDAENPRPFESNAGNPVDLVAGPNGDLYYADLDDGAIHRIGYGTSSLAEADRTNGIAPLAVAFDGSRSAALDGGPLTYSWSFGDGSTASTVAPAHTFVHPGTYTVRLTVTDDTGKAVVGTPITISAGNTPPAPVVDLPTSSKTWSVGDTIHYAGHATDGQDPAGALALRWDFVLHHCATPTTCHTHLIETHTGAVGDVAAPDHGYPSYLELRLTATDTGGLSTTTSVVLDPNTTPVSVDSNPSGAQVIVNGQQATTPYTATAIVNSTVTLQALSPQTVGDQALTFSSWSDGGSASHTLTAPATPTTYTATFSAPAPSGGGGGGGGGYPDLGLGLAADSTDVLPGASVRLEATVANRGLGGSTDDSLTLALPPGVLATLAKSDRGAGCLIGVSSIGCDLAWTSTGMAAHVIVLLQFTTPGRFSIAGVAAGAPADTNPADNSAALEVLVRDPTAPFQPPAQSPPSLRLLTAAPAGRTVQAARHGRYVVASLAVRVENAAKVTVSAERRDAQRLRPAWLVPGTTVGGVPLGRPTTSIVRSVKSGERLAVRVRIAPGSLRGALQLRFVTAGGGGRVVTVVPLHVVG